MEISFSTMFFHDHPLDRIFQAAGLSGADTVEFWPETPDWWLDGMPMNRLTRSLEKYRFRSPLSVHAPVLDLNPCSINPDVVEVSTEWVIRSLDLAAALGAGVCTFHPGRRTSKRPPTETDYRRLDRLLNRIAPHAGRLPVKMAIENMEPQVNALLSTPGEVFRILDEWDWLWLTLDACHVAGQGQGVLDEYLDGAGDRIANVHLSGASGSVMHQPVSGDRWADTALESLEGAGYRGLITLEINDLSLGEPLSYDEKVTIVRTDVERVRRYFSSSL